MKKVLTLCVALAVFCPSFTAPAVADNSEEIAIGIIGVIGGMILGAAVADGDHPTYYRHRRAYVNDYPDDYEHLEDEEGYDEDIQRREEFKSKMQGRRKGRREHIDYSDPQQGRCEQVIFRQYDPGSDRYETLRRYKCW
jgi:hypothetical protein